MCTMCQSGRGGLYSRYPAPASASACMQLPEHGITIARSRLEGQPTPLCSSLNVGTAAAPGALSGPPVPSPERSSSHADTCPQAWDAGLELGGVQSRWTATSRERPRGRPACLPAWWRSAETSPCTTGCPTARGEPPSPWDLTPALRYRARRPLENGGSRSRPEACCRKITGGLAWSKAAQALQTGLPSWGTLCEVTPAWSLLVCTASVRSWQRSPACISAEHAVGAPVAGCYGWVPFSTSLSAEAGLEQRLRS